MKKELLIAVIVFCLLVVTPSWPTAQAWELERPGGTITINERTENATTDGKASVGIGVHIEEYNEHKLGWPSDGDDDIVNLRIVATANTRQIIEYEWANGYYQWIDESQLVGGSIMDMPDEAVGQIMLNLSPFNSNKIRFYGGPGSAEYTQIWVSSNGWLSFVDPQRLTPPSPTPYYDKSIPDTAGINGFVAPFWRDLKPNPYSGSVRISYGWCQCAPDGFLYRWCFVVTWNATDKYYRPNIFQVIMENAPPNTIGQHPYWNSLMWFQYKSVTLTDSTTVGIEDQGGRKGLSYNYLDLQDNMILAIVDPRLGWEDYHYARILSIAIRLEETEGDAATNINEDQDSIRGNNVELNQTLPPEDPNARYATAIGGTVSLLISAVDFVRPWIWLSGGGLILDGVLVLADLYSLAATQLAAARLLDINNTYAEAMAWESNYDTFPVDAVLGITAYWIFQDSNNYNHTLTITSELTYQVITAYEGSVEIKTITSSVQLKQTIDNNNGESAAQRIVHRLDRLYVGKYDTVDFYRTGLIWVGFQVFVQARDTTQNITSGRLSFSMTLYDQYGHQISTGYDNYHEKTFIVNQTSIWYIKICPDRVSDSYGFYSLTVNAQPAPPPPDGGGCPILYVYNGTDYSCEGLLDIHNSNGTDVILNHTLATKPMLLDGLYSIGLAEHPQTMSHIDRVRLYAILQNNLVIPLPSVSAFHSENGNVLLKLLFSDEWKTVIRGAEWNEGMTQSLELKFLPLPPWLHAKAFVFQIEGNNPFPK